VNRDNRILLFRDDRYVTKTGHMYIIVKEDNTELAVNNTNKILIMFKIFKDDTEALDNISFYEDSITSLKETVGLENLITLLFKGIQSVSALSTLLATNNYQSVDEFEIDANYLFTKDNACKIKKVDGGYEVVNDSVDLNINPVLSIMEHYFKNNGNYIKYLMIHTLPDGLQLIKDTNPDRNELIELV